MSENPNLIIYFALGFVILMRLMRRVQKWKSFSNKWLIELAQKQFPDDLSLNDAIEKAHMQDCDLLQLTRGEKIPICRFEKKYSSAYIDNKISNEMDKNNERDQENSDLCTQVLEFMETNEFTDKERLVVRYTITGTPNPEELGISAANIRVIFCRALKKINKWRQAHETEF